MCLCSLMKPCFHKLPRSSHHISFWTVMLKHICHFAVVGHAVCLTFIMTALLTQDPTTRTKGVCLPYFFCQVLFSHTHLIYRISSYRTYDYNTIKLLVHNHRKIKGSSLTLLAIKANSRNMLRALGLSKL